MRRRGDVVGSRQKENYTTLKNAVYRLFPWRRPVVETMPNYLEGETPTPKRHILDRNRTYMPILVQIGRLVQPVRETKKSKRKKKGKERNLQWQTGCSPRPPTLTKRYVVLRAGWSSASSSKFQVSSKSVERFSRCGGRYLPFPIPKAMAYITA